MKTNVTAAIGLVIIACATGAAAAITTFHTTLRNPGPSDEGIAACGAPVGSGTFAYDDSTHALSGTLTFSPAPATTAILYGPPTNYLSGLNCYSSPCSVQVQLQSADEADLLSSKDIAFLQTSGTPSNIAGYVVNDDGGIDSCSVDAGGVPQPDSGVTVDAGVPISDAAGSDAGPPDELLVGSCSHAGPPTRGASLGVLFAAAVLVARRRRTK